MLLFRSKSCATCRDRPSICLSGTGPGAREGGAGLPDGRAQEDLSSQVDEGQKQAINSCRGPNKSGSENGSWELVNPMTRDPPGRWILPSRPGSGVVARAPLAYCLR